jgi:hypothetical protein
VVGVNESGWRAGNARIIGVGGLACRHGHDIMHRRCVTREREER